MAAAADAGDPEEIAAEGSESVCERLRTQKLAWISSKDRRYTLEVYCGGMKLYREVIRRWAHPLYNTLQRPYDWYQIQRSSTSQIIGGKFEAGGDCREKYSEVAWQKASPNLTITEKPFKIKSQFPIDLLEQVGLQGLPFDKIIIYIPCDYRRDHIRDFDDGRIKTAREPAMGEVLESFMIDKEHGQFAGITAGTHEIVAICLNTQIAEQ